MVVQYRAAIRRRAHGPSGIRGQSWNQFVLPQRSESGARRICCSRASRTRATRRICVLSRSSAQLAEIVITESPITTLCNCPSTKRFSHGLQFNFNYTWSKMLDDQDSSGWGSRDGGQMWQDAYNPSLNYSLSNFDLPHMFKGSLVYDLPFGKGREFLNNNAVVDAILGGWQLGTTFVLESGLPFTPQVGTNNNSGALSGNWYPNLIGNPNISNPGVNGWFNTCTILQDGATFPSRLHQSGLGGSRRPAPSARLAEISCRGRESKMWTFLWARTSISRYAARDRKPADSLRRDGRTESPEFRPSERQCRNRWRRHHHRNYRQLQLDE